jgi:membrane fusion protein, multidrug efflux system
MTLRIPVLVMLGVFTCLLFLIGCGQEQPPAAQRLRPVRYHEVALESGSTAWTFAGVTRAGVESRLSFRVPGTVDSLLVTVGDSVRMGQALARLDTTDFELRVEEAEAALALDSSRLRKATADYQRARGLYEADSAARSELDAARAAAESSQAQVEAADKQLEQARQRLGYTVLRAPVDGLVASVDVEVNEAVQSGRGVFLLASGSRPEVRVTMPEVLIERIKKGQPVSVSLDAIPDRSFPAEVAEVGVAATGTGTTFDVTVRFTEAEPTLRSGLAAEVTFSLGEAAPRLTVPPVAVGEDIEGRFVLVLEREGESEGIVHRRPVVVGQVGQTIEIVEGLDEGELVVTAGLRRLSDGTRVRAIGGQP